MRKHFFAVMFAASLAALSPAAKAGTTSLTFTGTFTYDNDVRLYAVHLDTPASLMAFTTSGASGGFPTYLAMYGGDGMAFTQQSGDPTCLAGYSAYNADGMCNDAMVVEPPPAPGQFMLPGLYYVALTQWDNGMMGDLQDGFFHQDPADRNFTNAFNQCGPGDGVFLRWRCEQGPHGGFQRHLRAAKRRWRPRHR